MTITTQDLNQFLGTFDQTSPYFFVFTAVSKVELRPARPDDYDFLYRLHQASMKEYIAQVWGWDETWQQNYFAQHFDPTVSQIIRLRDQDNGVVSILERETEWFINLIEILPEYQRHGIGTAVIQTILDEGKRQGKPVALQVLKINPAQKLYARLGFTLVGETETHYLMRTLV